MGRNKIVISGICIQTQAILIPLAHFPSYYRPKVLIALGFLTDLLCPLPPLLLRIKVFVKVCTLVLVEHSSSLFIYYYIVAMSLLRFGIKGAEHKVETIWSFVVSLNHALFLFGCD